MKQYNKKSIVAVCALGLCLLGGTSCVDNLLDQTPKGELAASLYWQTEDDALQPSTELCRVLYL